MQNICFAVHLKVRSIRLGKRRSVEIVWLHSRSWQSFKAAHLFDAGPLSLGPHFNIATKFHEVYGHARPLHGGNMRHDLHRMHATDPVAGYGTLPHEPVAP